MILYVPWHRRRERWRHDHNASFVRYWRPEKVANVGKLVRVREGQFQAPCEECGTLFVADADRHVIYPPVAALSATI